MSEKLNLIEIKEFLNNLSEWELTNNGEVIEKDFTFEDFSKALDFINKVGNISEEENHHPNIFLHDYKKVKISLTTHSEKGLTKKDFTLAKRIDGL